MSTSAMPSLSVVERGRPSRPCRRSSCARSARRRRRRLAAAGVVVRLVLATAGFIRLAFGASASSIRRSAPTPSAARLRFAQRSTCRESRRTLAHRPSSRRRLAWLRRGRHRLPFANSSISSDHAVAEDAQVRPCPARSAGVRLWRVSGQVVLGLRMMAAAATSRRTP